jgi:hypothetical protein
MHFNLIEGERGGRWEKKEKERKKQKQKLKNSSDNVYGTRRATDMLFPLHM